MRKYILQVRYSTHTRKLPHAGTFKFDELVKIADDKFLIWLADL